MPGLIATLTAAGCLCLVGASPRSLPSPAQTSDQSTAAIAARIIEASEQERATLLARPEYATVAVVQALLALADKERMAGQLPAALAAYEAATAAAKSAGAERELGRALNGLADALFRLGNQMARALAVANESIALHERLNDPAGLAEAWNNLGNVRSVDAESQEAIPAYEKSLALWTEAGDRLGIARALNNIGNVLRGNDDEKAIEHLERARQILEELGDERRASVVIGTIGILHLNRGEYPEALEYTRQALAMQERAGDTHLLSRSLDVLGNIHVAQGAYGRALEYFHRSLELRLRVKAVFDAAESWNNIGTAHAGHGDYELAIAAYREALRLNRSVGHQWLSAEALLNLGDAAAALGQWARAEANYRESIRIAETLSGILNAASFVGHALRGLADVAYRRGRIRDAEAHLTRALGLHETANNLRGTADALTALAAIDLELAQAPRALARAVRAREIARGIDAQDLLWSARTLIGRAQQQLGHTDAARREWHLAIEAIDNLRSELLPDPKARARFLERRLAPFHELLALSIADGSHAEALVLAERAKARALADILQQRPADMSARLTPDERREERRLQRTLRTLNTRIQQERQRTSPDRSRIAQLETERAARRLELQAFEAALCSKHPDLRVQHGAATPFTLAETPEILPDLSTAVLHYIVADRRVFLFALTRTSHGPSLDAFTLPGTPASLAALARRFRERLATRDLAFGEDASRLYNLLIAPAQQVLAGKTHVIIIPDGVLWNVPFQALRDRQQRYLIESVAVSYAPSLTVLRETRRRPALASRTLLAMGKAEFGAQAEPGSRPMGDFGPLPDAERQARSVADAYGPGRSTIYLGDEAREDRFKVEAPRHSILHLVSHGVLDEASPLYSHLLLSPGGRGSTEDGLLEAWELLDLKLDAELVVLSACETGRGRIARGEGTVGTMWALFIAGARSTIVSQWKVEATSTTALMIAFHRGLATSAGTKASLLRAATLSVMKDPKYTHPFYWAPFVLVGDPY